jgi:hypothetical protein
LDFSKAFDKVPHLRLLHKIHHYGIKGNTQKWIRDFHHGREQREVLNGFTSGTAAVNFGLPQENVVRPLLVLLCINDLPEYAS